MAGYGGSTGKKDFCGPFTIDSLHFAIDNIKKELNAENFGLFGFGQGGNAALLLASQRNDITCLVCSNGGYDFRRHTDSDNMLRTVIEKKSYDFNMDDAEAVAYRSAILHIDTIHTPVFLLPSLDRS